MARAFRLAGLLRVRALQEEQAAARLAEANADKLRAIQRRAETERMLAVEGFMGDLDPAGWHAAVASRSALSVLSADAASAVAAAEEVVEERTDEWSEARTRTRTLDRLAQRHRDEVEAEDLRAEQAHLDEVAARARATAEADESGVMSP